MEMYDPKEYHINGCVHMISRLINQHMLFSETKSFEWKQFTHDEPCEENLIYDSSYDENGLIINNLISLSCLKNIYDILQKKFPTIYFIFTKNTLFIKWN